MSTAIHSRIDSLLEILAQNPIKISLLKEYCFNGISDESNLRALCWRILLGYLPVNRDQWSYLLEKQRMLYESFIEEILVKEKLENGDNTKVESQTSSDHPLNSCPNSKWTKFFKDNEVVAQINKDVRRLYPEIAFFQKATDYPCKILINHKLEPLCNRVNSILLDSEVIVKQRSGAQNLVYLKKSANEEYGILEAGKEAHWQVVERILFLYAKLNPGVKYIQGMNEIIGPIYYAFASDANIEWRKYAEADVYFCFQNLMTEIRDNFIRTMDDSKLGIEFRMQELFTLLQKHDLELYNKLAIEQRIVPQYFAFRWISLLLSQEFLLPDVIRIWDSLFCEPDKFKFLLSLCLCMIINIKQEILGNDFGANMRLLQNYPPCDMEKLLRDSRQMTIKSMGL